VKIGLYETVEIHMAAEKPIKTGAGGIPADQIESDDPSRYHE